MENFMLVDDEARSGRHRGNPANTGARLPN